MSADVLLIGSMGGIADVVAENLRQHSLTVESVPFPQNTFKDEFGYRRALKGAVDKFRPSFVIPIGHPLALSRMKGELPDGVTAIVESEDKIRLLDSKVDSSSLVSSLGIPQPAFYNTADDIPSGADVIFKRDRSFGGSGVYRPRTREAVVNLMNHEKGGRFLIEEFIDGEDYSVDAIRWGGRFFTGCYKSLGNRGQGPSTDRVKVQCPVIESYARKILDAVHYNGICGMDFRISRDCGVRSEGVSPADCGARSEGVSPADCGARVCFLECNPRFTGGISLQISSGLELPWLLYTCAAGTIPDIV